MAVRIVCPCCNKKLRVPQAQAGCWVICSSCDQSLQIPEPEEAGEKAPADVSVPADPPFPLHVRLGIASLVLGLISIMILCVPIVGYASLGLSAIGVLLGLGGLFNTRRERTWSIRGSEADGVPAITEFGDRPINYPLAGVAACLTALVLAIAPLLIR
jgi:hypothetical protein